MNLQCKAFQKCLQVYFSVLSNSHEIELSLSTEIKVTYISVIILSAKIGLKWYTTGDKCTFNTIYHISFSKGLIGWVNYAMTLFTGKSILIQIQ